ncbi:hypothetical protein [Lachnotalea glycerini]|uniref:hypothetical protein n=1 Tax=Lachnotalea glycerini TaxID=1763509 RepID=UPI001475756D|nr:hypothetical protein [Lachnotalea glycerini]
MGRTEMSPLQEYHTGPLQDLQHSGRKNERRISNILKEIYRAKGPHKRDTK